MGHNQPRLAKRCILGGQATRDIFVRQAMKAVAQNALVKEAWRQREGGGSMALRAVKCRIETGELRNTWEIPCGRFNARQIMRLMQGRQRHQGAELCHDGIRDHYRRAQIPPAMHHAMANGANGRTIQQRGKRAQNDTQSPFMALGGLGCREMAFGDHRPRGITQGKIRRRANAFHLAVITLQQPCAGHGKDREFERG